MPINRTFIIAEAGINHNGKIDIAFRLIDRALESGADAVKFQTYIPEKLVSRFSSKANYQIKNAGNEHESQLKMLKNLSLKFDDFVKLKEYCNKVQIIFLTTPFDHSSVDFIYNLVDVYKISSGEVTNLPFLEYISRKGKPIILSTGMCRLGEVESAVNTILKNQKKIKYKFSPLSLLHCTSNYPCPYNEVNLMAMVTMKKAFKLPVGYSDHTIGINVPVAAVALGAEIIEKHFTLDKTLPGPDHKASLEPIELKQMVAAIRNIEEAIGDGIKKPSKSEIEMMTVARKSLVARYDIKAGAVLSEDMIDIKRPSIGISPQDLKKVLGLTLKKDKAADEVIMWEDFKNKKKSL